MRLRFFALLITGAVLALATFVLLRFGQGYRLIFDGKEPVSLAETGLLAGTSTPDGASVYIDNKLTSATNTTINLPPGDYVVKIVKEGYLPWEKKVKIQKEVVTQTQALLFPTAPKLESITATGTINPVVDASGTSIAFGVASASGARKNGVFILAMEDRPILALRNTLRQIADESIDALSNSQFTWAPNGQELLAITDKSKLAYRLKTSEFNSNPSNITGSVPFVATQWKKEKEAEELEKLETLKPHVSEFIRKHFRIIAWSVDDTKLLYEATAEANPVRIPQFLDPPLIGANSQPEERDIKKGRLYVYDTKEDKNFFIKEANAQLPNPVWFPDNRHLVFAEDRQIKIIEYDGTNKTTVYAGPFEGNFVYPWPDGSRLVILTSLNPQAGAAPNLYTINLK